MLSRLIDKWLSDPSISENIVSSKHFPKKEGKMFAFPEHLHHSLIMAYQKIGITQLYAHQSEALKSLQAGNHTLIVSGVASGKSLIYQIAILDALLKRPTTSALLLFPTKALSHDQGEKLRQIASFIPALADSVRELIAQFDGDTSRHLRPQIIQNAHILLTNPDMLHYTLLPNHTRWARFFSDLRYILIDEIHIYRGVFGSHVANIIRRLKRIASYYGSTPQFILTTGTISAAEEFASKLIEEPLRKIEQDGYQYSDKRIWIYNPPIINPDLGVRRHPHEDAERFVLELVEQGLHSIIFCRSRKTVEMLLIRLREKMKPIINSVDGQIRSYRSGYLPSQRREIEHSLRHGETKTIVATNALELGIDIGPLDVTIIVGFPGSIASTWQQFGRSGRTDRLSLGILILSDSPLDQYLANNPTYLWESFPEKVIIDPDNPLILLAHLRCALNELPISHEKPHFGNAPQELLSILLDSIVIRGEALKGSQAYHYLGTNAPTSFSIRLISNQNVELIVEENGKRNSIGFMDYDSADWMVHPGAIYLHQGQSYQVERLDLENRIASLYPCTLETITQPIIQSNIVSLESTQIQELISPSDYPYQIAYGQVELIRQVESYLRLDWKTRRILEKRSLELPPKQLSTMAFWLSFSNKLVDSLRQHGAWTNDPNQYGSKWDQQKRLARQRDHYRCQLCGVSEGKNAHHVHHKIPFKLFSTAEEANKLDNLITLCPACHQKVESNVRVQSGLAALGYAITQISPFFAMCDRQDLGTIIDPKFVWCENLPTILIHEQIPGGIGLSLRLYEIAPQLLSSIERHIRACPCIEGCPSCTGPVAVNGIGGKDEALSLLHKIVS